MSQWGMKTANPLVFGRRHWFISQVSRGRRPNLITWEVNVLRSLMWSRASYLSCWRLLSWKLFTLWKFLRRPKITAFCSSLEILIPYPLPFHSGVQDAKSRALPNLCFFPFHPWLHARMSVEVNHKHSAEVFYCVSSWKRVIPWTMYPCIPLLV